MLSAEAHIEANAEAAEEFPALAIDNTSYLLRLAVLEYQLHECIVARLNNFHTADPFTSSAERLQALKRAQNDCKQIQLSLETLKNEFGEGNLPFDDSIKLKLSWAKFIGLAFFFSSQEETPDASMRSEDDKLKGLLLSITTFYDLFPGQTLPAKHHRLMEEMLTQIYILIVTLRVNPKSEAISIFNDLETFTLGEISLPKMFGKIEDIPSFRSRLEPRVRELYKAKGDFPEKYSWIAFVRHMMSSLRELYSHVDLPLIVKYGSKIFSSKSNVSAPTESAKVPTEQPLAEQSLIEFSQPVAAAETTEETETEPGTSSLPFPQTMAQNSFFLTQPPDVLMASQPQPVATQSSIDFSTFPTQHQSGQAQEDSEMDLSDLDRLPSQPQPDSSGPSISSALNNAESQLNVSSPPSIPKELKMILKETKVLDPRAFRGCLIADDDQLAEIIEGKHPAVVKAIARRELPKEVKVDSGAARSAVNKKSNMLERHPSAEKIAWTQSQSQPAQPMEFTPTPTSPTISASSLHAPGSPMSTGLSQSSSIFGRGRRKWEDWEVANLKAGMLRFGRNWIEILRHYKFSDRTNVNLKDKARSLEKEGFKF